MKKRLGLKIFAAILFIGTGLYIYKNWESYNDKIDIEPDKIDYSQIKLDVKELKTDFANPIWFAKTESSVISFIMSFRNEGNRAFKDQMKILEIVIPCLNEGAGNRTASEFKKALQDNSISLSLINDKDNITVRATCLKKHFELAVELICDVLSKAHMKKEKIEMTKQEYLTSLAQAKFSPEFLANEKLVNILYPKGHPYYFSSDECSKAVKNYTKEDIDKAYSIIFNPNDAEITVAGNIDSDKLIESFNKIFKTISHKNHKFEKVSQKVELADKGRHEHVELDNAQSVIVFALPGVPRTSSERFAFRFANIVFGYAGFVSRLLNEVRKANGLVYHIYSIINDFDLQNFILGAAYTRPENVEKLLQKIKEECAKFYEKGITKEELEFFKYHISANNLLDTTEEILNFVDRIRANGIKIENVNGYLHNFYNLTIEEVNAVIRKIFNPNNLVIVDCGKSTRNTDNNKKEH